MRRINHNDDLTLRDSQDAVEGIFRLNILVVSLSLALLLKMILTVRENL